MVRVGAGSWHRVEHSHDKFPDPGAGWGATLDFSLAGEGKMALWPLLAGVPTTTKQHAVSTVWACSDLMRECHTIFPSTPIDPALCAKMESMKRSHLNAPKKMTNAQILCLQQMSGKFLCCARAADETMKQDVPNLQE